MGAGMGGNCSARAPEGRSLGVVSARTRWQGFRWKGSALPPILSSPCQWLLNFVRKFQDVVQSHGGVPLWNLLRFG